MSPTVDLALELIARKSLTPEDAGCQQSIATRLAKLGFHIENLRFGKVDNFWACAAAARRPVLRRAHGCRPAGPLEEWESDPFTPQIRDDTLFGRGAADMKSGARRDGHGNGSLRPERPDIAARSHS